MTMSPDPIGLHDWQSEEYVQEWKNNQNDAERAIYMRRLAYLIPRDPDHDLRVLDIGAGYGALSKVILEAYPHASVVVHDFSDPMLTEARTQLDAFSDSVSYVRADLMSPDWPKAFTGDFDAIVSTIAIHNVRFPDRIRAIYSELFPLVRPGGCFLNFDQVTAPGEMISAAERHAGLMDRRQRAYEEAGKWEPLESFVRRRGGAPREATTPEDQRRLDGHEPATLTNQMRWLREAGFDEVECLMRDSRRSLMGAYRSA